MSPNYDKPVMLSGTVSFQRGRILSYVQKWYMCKINSGYHIPLITKYLNLQVWLRTFNAWHPLFRRKIFVFLVKMVTPLEFAGNMWGSCNAFLQSHNSLTHYSEFHMSAI